MAIIKIHTSIEQSKKLLELGLNPESADMIHVCSIVHGRENGFLDVVPKESILYSMYTTVEEKEKSLPCWSLTALLCSLPFPVLYMEMVAGVILWCCECHFMEIDEVIKIEHYEDPIDACIAMIEKLNELNLL